jgi:signal peptide peptidase SppA
MLNRILAEIHSKPWLIQADYLRAISNVASGKEIIQGMESQFIANQIGIRKEALAKEKGQKNNNDWNAERRGNVGILNITGPIIRYGGMMELSGYTSLDRLSKEYTKLEDDKSIKTIVLNIDTPGGQASGIAEFAEYIKISNKKTIAYVDDLAASAGYWIASACDEIVASGTSMVGSIGVVFTLSDDSERRKNQGVQDIEIVSSVSPKKRPDATTDDGKEQIQAWADKLGRKFVSAVSEYRGVSYETVIESFGKGDILISDEALDVKMIDRISNFESLIQELQSSNKTTKSTKKGEMNMDREQLQAEHPDVYAEVYGLGVAAESARIQAIELVVPVGFATHESIQALKFDGQSDATGVKAALFDLNEEQKKNLKSQKQNDGDALAKEVKKIDSSLDENNQTEEKNEAKRSAALEKINAKRGN